MNLIIIFIFVFNCCKVWSQEDNVNFNAPQAETTNLKMLETLKYDLRELSPNSERLETIYFEPAGGQPIVKGSMNTYYPETMTNLIVNYVADKSGYRASFYLVKSIIPANGVAFQTRLSPNSLKSLAG